MDPSLPTLQCQVVLASGATCGQGAVLLDADRHQLVCLAHAAFLSADQRTLIHEVLEVVANATPTAVPPQWRARTRSAAS
jgi:hypothetical protein